MKNTCNQPKQRRKIKKKHETFRLRNAISVEINDTTDKIAFNDNSAKTFPIGGAFAQQ